MRKLIMVLRVALRAVTAHKMRSALTMLGVVIGVAAVISLGAVGHAAQAQVVSQFEALGSNLLTVMPGVSFGFSRGGLQQSSGGLTNADVEAIAGLATAVSLVAPQYNANATVTHGGNTTNITINGVTADYAEVRNWDLASGRVISQEDNEKMEREGVGGKSAGEERGVGRGDTERRLVLVKGALPGPAGGDVIRRQAVKARSG